MNHDRYRNSAGIVGNPKDYQQLSNVYLRGLRCLGFDQGFRQALPWLIVLTFSLVSGFARGAETVQASTASSTSQVTARIGVVVDRGSFPQAITIRYFDGQSWLSMAVGPGMSDSSQLFFQPSNSPWLQSIKTSPVMPTVGSQTSVTTDAKYAQFVFARSTAQISSGPLFTIPVDLPSVTFNVTRTAPGTPGAGETYTVPAIRVKYVAGPEGNWTIDGTVPPPLDTDGDGLPDTQDDDDDGDGRPDATDDFPLDPDEKDDYDGDGIGDNSDGDIDGDGRYNDQDKFPYNSQEWADADGDGVGDNQDPDDNTRPPGDAGTGENDNQGDGNGNPKPGGTGGGSGGGTGGGTPGTNQPTGSNGAPGGIGSRERAYGESQRTGDKGSIGEAGNQSFDKTVAGGFIDTLENYGETVENKFGTWNPFANVGTVGGDLTQFTISNSLIGTHTVVLPVNNADIGIFRGCCLFALYTMAVFKLMKILRV